LATNKCSLCGEEFPGTEGTPTERPVCPRCAGEHFLNKTQRIRFVRALLDIYNKDKPEQQIDDSGIYEIASDFNRKLESKPDGEVTPPAA
jgi:hypothetical protein